MKLTSITPTGKSGSVTAPDTVFGAKVNDTLLAQAIRVYRANLRQGTSKVLTRSEVKLTKRKWYKQKGTGNARHGAKSAPIFVGGGVAHGPTGMENWSLSLSRKMKAKALVSALSAQAVNIVVADSITELSGKTKEAVALLESVLADANRVLIVLADRNANVEQAVSNIPSVITTTASLLNAYDVAAANKVVMTSDAIKALEARLVSEASKEVEVKKASAPKAAPKKAAPKKTKAAKKSE
ncbi:MAG: 50S ribosomal protein L4 [Pseudomonadales bacterium]|nr:50S ribosomal protein L4 [Pseudomonadales bacterium]